MFRPRGKQRRQPDQGQQTARNSLFVRRRDLPFFVEFSPGGTDLHQGTCPARSRFSRLHRMPHWKGAPVLRSAHWSVVIAEAQLSEAEPQTACGVSRGGCRLERKKLSVFCLQREPSGNSLVAFHTGRFFFHTAGHPRSGERPSAFGRFRICLQDLRHIRDPHTKYE